MVVDFRRYQDPGIDDLGVDLLTGDLSESPDRIERSMTTVAALAR